MWRFIAIFLAAACLGPCVSAQEDATAGDAAPGASRTPVSAGIPGVWKVTELASRVPGAEWEVWEAPYLSQYIFTDKHYSYMYVPGPGPRKKFAGDPNRPTDAEKAEAYNSLVAATGTYSLSGQVLTLTALVHKNPNEMTGEALAYMVEVDGNTLRMVIANPPFLPGGEWRIVLTRAE